MLQLIKRIVLKSQLFIATVAAVLIGISAPALAQMNIEITGVGQSLYPIAVMRFKDEQIMEHHLKKRASKMNKLWSTT